MCVLFYPSFVCISAYANIYLKTTIIKQNIKIILIAGVPSSQALLGFLITAPPSVCVPDAIGVLTVWNQNQHKNQKNGGADFWDHHHEQPLVKTPSRGASALPADIILIFWRKEFFCFLFFYLFYLGLFFEIIHEPLSLEEGTLAEDDSLQAQAYLVLDRREEVRQAP